MAFGNASDEFWVKTSSKPFFSLPKVLSQENISCSVIFEDTSDKLEDKMPSQGFFSMHNGNYSSPEVNKTPKSASVASKRKTQTSSSPFVGFAVSSTPNTSQSSEFSDKSASAPSFFENSPVKHVSNENIQENVNHQGESFATNGISSGNKSKLNYSKFGRNECFGGVKLKDPQRTPKTEPTINFLQPIVNNRGIRKATRSLITTKPKENTRVIDLQVSSKDEIDKKQITSNEKGNDQPILVDSLIELNLSGDQVKEHAKQMHRKEDIASLENNIAKLTSLLRELDGVRALNDMRTVSMMVQSLEKTVQLVRDVFKCEICFSPQYNYFYFCPDCGRMVGCYICAYQIDRCSTCRKRLPVRKNRVPHFIPGLAVALDENEMTRDELKKRIEKLS